MSIIVLIGPSGSGKDTIGNELSKVGIPELVSFTTREKRPGEINGENYFFVDEEELKSLEIVESTTYSGNKYGLLKKEVEESLSNNENVYFISNLDGAKQLTSMYPDEVIVFWLRIDFKTMRSRMIKRGDSEKNISKRLEFAKETNETTRPDFPGLVELNAKRTPEELYKIIRYKLLEV